MSIKCYRYLLYLIVKNLKKEEKLEAEEKALFSNLYNKQLKIKEDEIFGLKNEISTLNSEILENREIFKNNFEEVKSSVYEQITLIKERETLTNRQYKNLEEKYSYMVTEKDNIIRLQKSELETLSKSNKFLAKLKLNKE